MNFLIYQLEQYESCVRLEIEESSNQKKKKKNHRASLNSLKNQKAHILSMQHRDVINTEIERKHQQKRTPGELRFTWKRA